MDSKELQDSYGSAFLQAATSPQNSYQRVREFHETFEHPVSDSPTTVEDERYVLRLSLILEEAIELADALGFPTADIKDSAAYMLSIGPRLYEDDVDLVAVADALGDIEYVVNGAALEMGIDLPAVVKEIHRSNMTKLDADGKPIYREDGKVLKGEGYEPPQLEKVLWSE